MDDEGVALGEMKPDDQMPAFFVRGWNEEGTEEARQENVGRVKKYLELVREWNALGLSERVSEVTLVMCATFACNSRVRIRRSR